MPMVNGRTPSFGDIGPQPAYNPGNTRRPGSMGAPQAPLAPPAPLGMGVDMFGNTLAGILSMFAPQQQAGRPQQQMAQQGQQQPPQQQAPQPQQQAPAPGINVQQGIPSQSMVSQPGSTQAPAGPQGANQAGYAAGFDPAMQLANQTALGQWYQAAADYNQAQQGAMNQSALGGLGLGLQGQQLAYQQALQQPRLAMSLMDQLRGIA